MLRDYADEFAARFREWSSAACAEWSYPELAADHYHKALSRIPRSVQA